MSSNEPIIIDLNIGDQLTSISCGHIVVEIIKFLAYQRLQIPYNYQWLKHSVNKRKLCGDLRESHQSEKHFYVASTALEKLDFIIKSLLKEIHSATIPEEVCIILGATPYTCKEIYRILLPQVCHKQQCHSTHIASDQKIQKSVFRTLVTSEKLSNFFFNGLPPTNMFIFIKKKKLQDEDVVCSDTFVLSSGYKIPRSSKMVCIDFRTQSLDNISCCNNLQIFGDALCNNLDHLKIDEVDHEFSEIESTDKIQWFQSSYVMRGFKDCIINGSSITNTWLKS